MQDAVISGVMMGLSGLFVHMGMKATSEGAGFLLSFILVPWTWVSLLAGCVGFFYLQKALYSERIAYVIPTMSSLSIVTPVVLSAVFLGEYVPLVRWIGLWLVLVGVIGISKGEWDQGLVAAIMKRVKVKSA